MDMKSHVKKGDTVTVIAGNDKGKSGKILRMFPREGLVLVEGVGMCKKHAKPRRAGVRGQIIEVQRPIHASNVKLKK